MSLYETFRDDVDRAKAKMLLDIQSVLVYLSRTTIEFKGIALTHARLEANTTEKYIDLLLQEPMFLRACQELKIEPTRRQAKKFFKGEGAAWNYFLDHGMAWEADKG